MPATRNNEAAPSNYAGSEGLSPGENNERRNRHGESPRERAASRTGRIRDGVKCGGEASPRGGAGSAVIDAEEAAW